METERIEISPIQGGYGIRIFVDDEVLEGKESTIEGVASRVTEILTAWLGKSVDAAQAKG